MSYTNKISLDLRGLEEFLEQLNKLGAQADAAVNEALEAGIKPMVADMKRNASMIGNNNTLADAVYQGKVVTEGNRHIIKAGISYKRDPEAFYGHFWEFGFRGRDGKTYGHPFIWPAYEKNKRKAIKIMADVFRRRLGL